MDYITTGDFLILPVYLLVIYKIAYAIRNKYYMKGHPWRSYFIPALTAKISGAILIGLIYQYYYKGGGDTFGYFYHLKLINQYLFSDPGTWFRIITHNLDERNVTDALYLSEISSYDNIPSYSMACIGSFFGLIGMSKYLVVTTITACACFGGSWALFKVFAEKYPHLHKPVAIATLFMPSVLIWGSGLSKDGFCLLAISLLTYCFYQLFERRKKPKLRYLLLIVLSVSLLWLLKIYILLAFLPLLMIKSIWAYKKTIKSRRGRIIFIILFFIVAPLTIKWASGKIVDGFSMYSVENIAETAKKLSDAFLQGADDNAGSTYNLGEFDPTINGMLRRAAPAINVTLYRPYIWESTNPLMLLASLESLFFLLFSLRIILGTRINRFLWNIYSNNDVLFCLSFTLIFGFFVGLSTSNFGALSRFKIPMVPFFMLALVILYSQRKKQSAVIVQKETIPAV